MILDFEPGDKVINPDNKEWGIGQVQSMINEKITVNFENVGKKVINSNNIKLCLKYITKNLSQKFTKYNFKIIHFISDFISFNDWAVSGPTNFFIIILFSLITKVSGIPYAPSSIEIVPSLSIRISE